MVGCEDERMKMKTLVGSYVEVCYYLLKDETETLAGLVKDIICLTDGDYFIVITSDENIDTLLNLSTIIKIRILKSNKVKEKVYDGIEIG